MVESAREMMPGARSIILHHFFRKGEYLVKEDNSPVTLADTEAEEYLRGFAMGGTLFEELGFYYVGPIDGHDLDQLLPVLIGASEKAHILP